jgi:hypothetical protein
LYDRGQHPSEVVDPYYYRVRVCVRYHTLVLQDIPNKLRQTMPVFPTPYIKSRWTANENRREKELILYSARLCSRRKGKERKGKERKGKERKGKERKGKVDRKERKSRQKSLVGMVVVVTFLRVR